MFNALDGSDILFVLNCVVETENHYEIIALFLSHPPYEKLTSLKGISESPTIIGVSNAHDTYQE